MCLRSIELAADKIRLLLLQLWRFAGEAEIFCCVDIVF